MAKYYRRDGSARQSRSVRFIRAFLIVSFFGIAVVSAYLGYDIYKQTRNTESPSQLSKEVTTLSSSNLQQHSTPYFEFQTTDTWRPVASETRDGHYVYREFKRQVTDQELVIDVNNDTPETLDNTLVSRVLPVKQDPDGTLMVANSDLKHCKTYITDGSLREQRRLSVLGTSFPCNPDSVNYITVAALVGGSEVMKLKNPSGRTVTIKMTYRNFSAQQRSGDMINMIDSFRLK